jgi:hypothetical protein
MIDYDLNAQLEFFDGPRFNKYRLGDIEFVEKILRPYKNRFKMLLFVVYGNSHVFAYILK